MNSLRQQLLREKRFHDQWATSIRTEEIDVDVAFEGSTAPENRFICSCLGDLTGKYLLDLGCGAGESSVYFARHGAHCIAGDYSSGMLRATNALAQRYGVDIDTRKINAIKLEFANNTFDIVYASNILHHVDADKALHEIHRVLKPGGFACMWEPLKHNPIINVYRRMATEVRTADEKPLSIFFIDKVKRLFSQVTYDTFWLSTLWILLRFYLIERVDPNKERYWKKILVEEFRLRRTYNRLERIDYFLKKIPIMRRLAWTLAMVAKK
jgi:ubiquinone/menaquinone biosynthesis C-methylase UbiE